MSSKLIYMVEKASSNKDFDYKATRVDPERSVPRTKSLDVKSVFEGNFYEKDEEIRVMDANIMSREEVAKLEKQGKKVKFNDPEMNI